MWIRDWMGHPNFPRPPEDACRDALESVTISIEQTSGKALDSPDTAADWEALCRKIQPQLQSANPDLLNQLMKEHPLAKDLPEIPVRTLEPPSKSPASSTPKDH